MFYVILKNNIVCLNNMKFFINNIFYKFKLKYVLFYEVGGKGAKHKRISPNDATLYLTIKGRLFSK